MGKEYVKAVYCHLAYLAYVKSTSCEMLDWMKQSWNQDCREKYQNLRYADDTILMAESEEELKSLLRMKEESEIADFKLSIWDFPGGPGELPTWLSGK